MSVYVNETINSTSMIIIIIIVKAVKAVWLAAKAGHS